MPEASTWIDAVGSSHERFIRLVQPLHGTAVEQRSYDSEWSIAQVASHLGSQAEIFMLFLQAGLSGTDAPGAEQFAPIWDRWNDRTPQQQVVDSVAANERFVARLRSLSDVERAAFRLSMFGSQLDLAGMVALRLAEHAVHTWDIAVALDPTAVVSADAVELLLDRLPATAAHSGKASDSGREVVIDTVSPDRRFLLGTGPDVTLTIYTGPDPADLQLPAEALLRLVYGRLDSEHTPSHVVGAEVLDELRPVFPGV